MLKNYERCILIAEYILQHKATVRATAPVFGYSKSTIFNDVTKILKRIDYALYLEVQKVLNYNKEQRHIRGGKATKRRYTNV